MTKGLKLGFVIVIGGIIMTLLSGCDKRNNREWLENKFGTELSRVYPTQNVEDLFKEFPDGFKIDQSYRTGGPHGLLTQMVLVGDGETHSISGTLNQIDLSTKDEKETASVVVEYQNGELVFSDEEKAKEIWPFNGFLFQHLTIDKFFLSKQNLKNTFYNTQNGAFEISYSSKNKTINHYLNKKEEAPFTLEFGGSNYNKEAYYYSVTGRYDDGSRLIEIVSN